MRKLASLFLILCVFALPLAAETSGTAWGARAAAIDTEFTLADMLRYAIEDEYLARAEYAAIQNKFGAQRPFSNIIKSEESHIGWLKDAYAKAGLPVPKDGAAAFIVVPATLKDAFQTGVNAEIENIAMYESFIASPLINRPENASLKALFIRLRDASKNHLASFRNGLSR